MSTNPNHITRVNGEDLPFYARKLKQLREKSNVSQKEMAEMLHITPPQITKLEKGEVKNISKYAEDYALHLKYLGFDKKPELEKDEAYLQKVKEFLNKFLIISTYAVPDTNAIEANPRLIEELLQKYPKVIVPNTVITELEFRKRKRNSLQNKEISKAVATIKESSQVITVEADRGRFGNNDDRIIGVAKQAATDYNCRIHIITDDKGFKAKQPDDSDITVISLSEFMADRYSIKNYLGLYQIDKATDNFVKPNDVDMRAYLPNGDTLITSTIRNKSLTPDMKIRKIKWLCENGADINQRESSGNFFPPLTIVIQQKDREEGSKRLFNFILNDLHADPNAGSRNPYSLKMVRQQNEGNMPLMVAARGGCTYFVKVLCEHPDIILNQQDSNGFTALIKTAYRIKELCEQHGKVIGYNRYRECCEILIDHGIDYRILDVDGHNAAYYFDHIQNYLERKKDD